MSFSLDKLLRPIDEEPEKKQDNARTIQTFHTTEMNRFHDMKNNVELFKKELKEKKEQLKNLELYFETPSLIKEGIDIQFIANRNKLEKEILDLEHSIQDIESGTTVNDYFLRVGEILFSYNDAQQRIATGESHCEKLKKARIPKNSVYSCFLEEELEEDLPKEQTCIKKASDISNNLGFKRDKAMETYLSALNPDSLQTESTIAGSIREDYGNCPVCETEMFLNETFLDCPDCGYRDVILIDSEKPSYKDPPREMSYYAYKKINHLNEWLAQFQAKETTEISQAVLDQIRTELKKQRITDMSKLKATKLKEVIKKLKLSRCYDHIAHVLNRLNGVSAPVLSREVEEKLRFMFKEIQFSFVKHCPKKRSNFLSYSFVLYKFCELLELDEYLPCFPLLKNREKLYMQDKIWQKICEDMGWEFIRTV